MHNIRREDDAPLKGKVALEATKREKAFAQLSGEFGVHANQIRQWQKQFLEELHHLFSDPRRKQDKDQQELMSEFYHQIGQLKTELE